MRRRFPWYWLVALLGLLPNLGCLGWGQKANPLIPPLDGGNSNAQREVNLPPEKSCEACLSVARSEEAAGHLKHAADQFELARAYNPRVKGVARRLAVIYDRLGQHHKAETEYQLALQETPRDANLLNNYGYFHHNRGKWQEAEDLFHQALKIQPKNKHAWSNLGLVLAIQGKYPESLDAYKHAVSEAEAHSNIAFVLQTQKKFDEAKHEYRLALQLEPGWQQIRLMLEKLERGEAPLEEAAPLSRSDAAVPPPNRLPAAVNQDAAENVLELPATLMEPVFTLEP
jgi:Tfp pilus assembly protein PilF